MGESKSRYGIVFDLTQQKMNIIDELNNLESEVEIKKLDAIRTEQKIDKVKKRYEIEMKREIGMLEGEVSMLSQEAENLDKFKDKRKKALEEKKIEIDNALKALQEISKSAIEQENIK